MPINLIPLPIDSYLPIILNAFSETNNLILMAPPGSGKTLRVPALLARQSSKKIVVLVPKRIAAVAAANRVAEENNWQLGQEVGYQVRFEQKWTAETKLIFMTEGVFVKRMGSTKFLDEIDTVVFDEFHERSSLNDIAFGYCYEQQLLSESKPPLKILVMSATLETTKLSRYLQNAVIIQVDTKPHPLQIIKSKRAQRLLFDYTLADQIVEAVKLAYRVQKNDILIFLPGMHEIRMVQNRIIQSWPQAKIEILHGSIKLDDQKRILSPAAHRRLILATNVAESSLTLPSVDCVIDSGLEKRSVAEKKIGFKKLELKRISIFSAKQRAGRAARLGPGVCYELWHESDESSMSEQIEPEILKSSLFEETLILLSTGVNPEIFSWLDRPTHSFRPVLRKFEIWKLIDSSGKLTDSGREVQRCPLDLERAILFVELSKNGFQKEAARLIAFLETADFSKVSDEFSLERITLNDLGRRIENQLLSHRFFDIKESESFRNSLFKIFIHYFPEKMAQKKEGANGISSLGRGVQFSPHLISEDSNYFLLLNGRDISDAVTWVDFAISFSQKEFQTLSYDDQLTQTEYIIDFEKKTIYKQLKKSSGYFVVSTSAKTPLDPKLDVNAFREVFNQQIDALIEHHPHSKNYFTKINFLKNRKEILGYTELDFNFQKKLPELVLEALADSLKTLAEFLDYDLQSLLTYLTPDRLKKDLQKLHSNFTLPSGKIIPINYETELAPLISVRVQDALGLFKTPHLLDQRVSITIEFLAPNYRPAQITGDLENFWKLSYYEIRKEYRARYPRHDWPESPLDWKPEMSKRLKPKPR